MLINTLKYALSCLLQPKDSLNFIYIFKTFNNADNLYLKKKKKTF
jgi:hypothetical protein